MIVVDILAILQLEIDPTMNSKKNKKTNQKQKQNITRCLITIKEKI